MKQTLLSYLLAQLIWTIKGQVVCNDTLTPRNLDWDTLQADGTGVPEYNLSITWDPATLSIDIEIELEYIGNAGDMLNTNNELGTTYVIDFYSFGTSGNSIASPGSCQNRQAADFIGIDFDDMWDRSDRPWEDLNDPLYLAYPPVSSPWTIEAGDDASACDRIKYSATFDFVTLQQCTDPNTGNALMVVDNSGAESIDLGGTLYVNLISPYSMGITDSGFYRSYPLVQQDFLISINKQIDVLASTGVQLFIISIIAIFETDNGNFQMSVLTQSADYLELKNPDSVGLPVPNFDPAYDASMSQATSTCLVASSFTCGQIFTLEIDESQITCNSTNPADFSGDYNLIFEVHCKNTTDADTAACLAFLDDNGGPQVNLDVSSTFIDTTCVPELYSVSFDGVTTFYDDDQFTIVHDPANGAYVIGQSQIYIEVAATFPSDPNGNPYDILAVELNNVYVCTADDGADLSVDQVTGLGGCLSPNIDADGPYTMIDNGVANPTYFAENIVGSGESYVRFSFLTFDSARTTIQVHTQLTVVLVNGARRRLNVMNEYGENGNLINSRRLLQDEDVGSNQIRHFIDATGISSEVLTNDEDDDDNDLDNNNRKPGNDNDEETGLFDGVLLYIIIALVVVCMCGVAFIIMKKMKESEKDTMEKTMTNVVMTNTSSTATTDGKKDTVDVQVNYQ